MIGNLIHVSPLQHFFLKIMCGSNCDHAGSIPGSGVLLLDWTAQDASVVLFTLNLTGFANSSQSAWLAWPRTARGW